MERIPIFIDYISAGVGKAFGWLILVLTLGVSYEVFVRYVLRAPTSWAYDVSYIMYGSSFLMAGAYTLSRNGHVRGDVIFRLLKPRLQAAIELVLYIAFFFPGVTALVYYGIPYVEMSWRFNEVSVYSPAGIPIYPLKTLIPIAGGFLILQGIAEFIRCILCLRDGRWPPRIQDVEELESAILHEREFAAQQERESGPDADRGSAR